MKFIGATRKELTFQMEEGERLQMLTLLELYPLVPASYQRLSKSDEHMEAKQLLDEALAAQRRENKKQIAAMLTSGRAFQQNEEGYRFTLKVSRVDWLLQVLNDINVGSWLRLGAPDDRRKMAAQLNEKTAPFFWAHLASGRFQVALIYAVSGEAEGDSE